MSRFGVLPLWYSSKTKFDKRALVLITACKVAGRRIMLPRAKFGPGWAWLGSWARALGEDEARSAEKTRV